MPVPVVVSVVIASACDARRGPPLFRAIESVASQAGVSPEVIVVANGDRVDASILARLAADARVTLVRRDQGHVSAARLSGLEASSGRFFTFLDDDDELLPDALHARVGAIGEDPAVDVLVTNGYIRETSDFALIGDALAADIGIDQEGTFLRRNWFASPALLFRRESFRNEFFDIPYRYFEWTYLFFKLRSEAKTILFRNLMTYRKYEDNPDSVSRSNQYKLGLPAVLRDIQRLYLAPATRAAIRHDYIVSLNECSTVHLANNRIGPAVSMHLACLRAGGWRYLPYSRKILMAAMANAWHGR
jgi:glycosyltransferase involved in cell wall biosynthesis